MANIKYKGSALKNYYVMCNTFFPSVHVTFSLLNFSKDELD